MDKLIFISAPDASAHELQRMSKLISDAILGLDYKVILIGKDWKSISKEELSEMLKKI